MSIYTLQDLKSVQTGMQRMPVGVLPSTLAENFGAHVDAMLGADSGAAPMVASRAAAQRAYEWLQERTGRDPVDLGTEAATELTSQALAERRAQGMTAPQELLDWQSDRVARAALAKYLAEHPDTADAPDLDEEAFAFSREVEARRDDVSARATFWGDVVGVAGDLTGGLLAPESLLTLPLALPGRAAVGARAILRAATREGVLAATIEAPVQALVVQPYRADAGLDAGFWQGVANVAVVGAGSAALGGLVRGVIEGRNYWRTRGDAVARAARNEFESLTPEAKESLADAWNDLAAVENVVTREFETNARFRNALDPRERAAIELAIANRQATNLYDVRTPEQRTAVEDAVGAVVEAVETGTPVRPQDLEGSPPAKAPTAPEIDLERIVGEPRTDAEVDMMAEVQKILRETAEQPAEPAPRVVEPEPEEPKLPKVLAGARSHYQKARLEFETDVDRALFITSQARKSKRDAGYRDWLKSLGLTDEQIDAYGQQVRGALRDLAADEGVMRVPRQTYTDLPSPAVQEERARRRKDPKAVAKERKGALPPAKEQDAAAARHETAEIEAKTDAQIAQEAEDTARRTTLEAENPDQTALTREVVIDNEVRTLADMLEDVELQARILKFVEECRRG